MSWIVLDRFNSGGSVYTLVKVGSDAFCELEIDPKGREFSDDGEGRQVTGGCVGSRPLSGIANVKKDLVPPMLSRLEAGVFSWEFTDVGCMGLVVETGNAGEGGEIMVVGQATSFPKTEEAGRAEITCFEYKSRSWGISAFPKDPGKGGRIEEFGVTKFGLELGETGVTARRRDFSSSKKGRGLTEVENWEGPALFEDSGFADCICDDDPPLKLGL